MDCRGVERVVPLFTLAIAVVLAGCAGLNLAMPTPDDGPETDLPGSSPAGTLEPGEGRTVTVVDVVDGDTLDIRYSNGSTDRVRLLGVDTPEVGGENDPDEYEGVPETDAGESCLLDAGRTASDFAERWLAGEQVTIVVDETADRRGDYGRLLAYVHVDGVDFNYRLLARGHARVYDTTFARADRYYAAESDAQSSRRGLWTCRDPGADGGGTDAAVATSGVGLAVVRVHADAAGNDHENRNDEYVTFRNAGESSLAVGGWTVSDAAGHTYTFPSGFVLSPGAKVTLRTGDGENTDSVLYWGADGAVWNNGGDTVTVRRDGETVLVYEYSRDGRSRRTPDSGLRTPDPERSRPDRQSQLAGTGRSDMDLQARNPDLDDEGVARIEALDRERELPPE